MPIGIGSSDKVVQTFGSTTATTPGVGTTASSSTFVVAIIVGAGVGVTSVSDNKSNTYSVVGSLLNYFGAAFDMHIYKSENGSGGAGHTVSVTIASSNFLTVFFQEITGASTGGEDTAVRASGTDSASPFTLTSGSLSQANEALFCSIGFNTANLSALSESTGFTITQSVLTGASDAPGAIAVRIVSATGTYTPSWTATGATDSGIRIIGFKEPAPINMPIAWISA